MIILILTLMLNVNIDINIDDFRVFDNKMMNVYEISNLNAREINERLQGTFLEDTGDMMYYIEQEKGINFRVIYAIAGLESGKGKKLSGKVKQRIDGLWLMYPAWQSGKSWGLMPNKERKTTVEIIGNIYENKELIDEVQDDQRRV
nr:MAG TPA: autolysin E [Caudoviricetes sp.]